jgi:hypothetical protein
MSGESTIEQHWDIKIVKDNPTFPFIVIDNWYTPGEEKAIWKELDYYSSMPKDKIDRAEDTVVARNTDGFSKSKAFRFYINQYYTNTGLEKSPIFNSMYKVRTPEFHNIMNECMPYGRSFLSSNGDSTLISYYEDDDHYDSHHDTFLWTQCTWFVREPRLFTGGDFDFPEPEIEIKLKHNRTVFFPCCYLHRVSPVKFHTQPKDIGYGRYTITHFYFSLPKG